MREPVIVPREQHSISRKQIDPDALKVLYRLHQNGHVAYLVGGSVRDLLLGRRPKDFDIGTSAHPYQVKRLFKNCWIIGRRFRLAHVRYGPKTIEVATFRRQLERNLAISVQLRNGNDIFMRRDLEHTVGRRVDDGLPGPDMLRSQLVDDDRTRGRLVSENPPADPGLETINQIRWKPLREDRKRAVEHEPHQLPVPGHGVLARGRFGHAAEGTSRAIVA